MVKLMTCYLLCVISGVIVMLLFMYEHDEFYRKVRPQQQMQLQLQLQQLQRKASPHENSTAKPGKSTSADHKRNSDRSFVAGKALLTALRWTESDWKRKPGDPLWQWVDSEFGVLLYAAHFDDVERPPLVRLIALARVPLPYRKVTCLFHDRCYRENCPVVLVTTGEVYHHRMTNGRNYIGSFIDCPLVGLPQDSLPYAVTVLKANDTERNASFSEIHYSGKEASAIVSLPTTTNTSRKLSNNTSNDSLVNKTRAEPDATNHSSHSNTVDNTNDTRRSTTTTASSDKIGAEYRWNITRCTPALHRSFNKHVQLAEMVSASRALGVDHFAFYVQSASPRVTNVLQVLETRGLATVFPWNLHMTAKNVFYTGQFSAIQDCLYRHLRSSKYLIFGDIDELFMPLTSASLLTLLDRWFEKMPKCGVFGFRNTFIDMKAKRSNGNTSKAEQHVFSLANKHGLTMLLHNVRNRKALTYGTRSKTALDPRRVERGSVHVVGKMRPGSKVCVLNTQEGLLFHYRASPKTKDTVVDDALWNRFAQPVLNGTLSILEAAGKLHERPK